MRFIDLTGHRYGKLTVIKQSDVKGKWVCLCDCGNETVVSRSNLRDGHTQSCGCIHRETVTKHNAYKDRLYNIWLRMKDRCNNPNGSSYSHYGERGIKICDEWSEYQSFRDWAMSNGYADNLTIERKDVNGNYEPSNCTWITIEKQANNTTRSRYVDVRGERMTVADASRLLGISYRTAYHYLVSKGVKL